MELHPTPTREQAASMDDRAEYPHLVPQWETAEGLRRYAIIRALSVRQLDDAERAAQQKGRDGAWAVNPYRLMIEIVRRGVVSPPDLPYEAVAGWNYDVVLNLFQAIEAVGGFVAAHVARELAALAGQPAPPVAAAAAARGADRDADGLDADHGAAETDDAGEPAGAVAG